MKLNLARVNEEEARIAEAFGPPIISMCSKEIEYKIGKFSIIRDFQNLWGVEINGYSGRISKPNLTTSIKYIQCQALIEIELLYQLLNAGSLTYPRCKHPDTPVPNSSKDT